MNNIKIFNLPTRKIKYGLSRTKKLLEMCAFPEKKVFSIQIIGTNGKGSVAAFLSNILVNGGYKTGIYTSPHLVKINERIKINHKPISEKEMRLFSTKYYAKAMRCKPSFFEIMTVMAMWYFSKNKVDIAILETGLGGRLDSVTACKNDMLAFTEISMDHHDILGYSLKKIANEKAKAMINKNQTCISVKQHNVVQEILIKEAKEKNIKIIFFDTKASTKEEFKLNYLYGKHQQLNANLASKIIETLNRINKTKISPQTIKKSIKNTQWNGRFQIIKKKPTIIYDVAHNRTSLEGFIYSFKNYIKTDKYENKYLICAFEKNKKIATILKHFEQYFHFIVCTETQIRSSMDAKKIKNFFMKQKKVQCNLNITDTIINVVESASSKDIVVIIGSHFIAPYLNRIFKNCFAPK